MSNEIPDIEELNKTFLALNDTPTDYTGMGGLLLAVDMDEGRIVFREFGDVTGLQSDWDESDPASLAYIKNKPLNLSDFNDDVVAGNYVGIDHLTDTNPHNISKSTIGLDLVENIAPLDLPINNDTQLVLNDKEDSLGLGSAGQVLATNLAGDGKEWIDPNAGGIPESPNDGTIYGRGGSTPDWVGVLPLSGGELSGMLTAANYVNIKPTLPDGNANIALQREDGTTNAFIYANPVSESLYFRNMGSDGSTLLTEFTVHDDGNVSTRGGGDVPTDVKHLTRKDYVDNLANEKVSKDPGGTTSRMHHIWVGTQTEYDLLGTYINTTGYFIM
jgi:hypothetical protein